METKKIEKGASIWGILFGIVFGALAAYIVYGGGMWLIQWVGDMMIPWHSAEIIILSILTMAVIFSSVVAACATFEYFKNK